MSFLASLVAGNALALAVVAATDSHPVFASLWLVATLAWAFVSWLLMIDSFRVNHEDDGEEEEER